MKNSLLATVSLLSIMAYNNKTSWKTDDAGALVLKDGNPVYLDSTGKEMTVDIGTITRLNGEARGHREAKEAADAKLKAFEGLDAEIARKAVETVSKLDAKKLIDAGEVDKLTDQIKSQFSKQITEKDAASAALQQKLNNMMIDNLFNGSEFARENIAVPRDMFQAYFRSNFKIEDDKVIAYDKAGNRLLSKTRSGEFAEADEALQLLVESHPQKDIIMKAQTGSGTGSSGNAGARGGGKTIKRSEFDALPPVKQSEVSAKVRTGEMQLTD